MMNHVSQLFQSWWFPTMTPARTPLTTLAQRENMRKRRLFSLVMFVSLTLNLGYIIYAVTTLFVQQMPICILGMGIILLALWLNQRGYLTLACMAFFLGNGLTT